MRRGLAAVLADARIEGVELRRGNLRFAFPDHFAERLAGRRVGALARRAKYILAPLDSGETLIMHLGMSGSFRIERGAAETPGAFHFGRSKSAAHDHVVFHLSNGARVTYNDPRRFGFMQLAPSDSLTTHPLFSRLGVEPLAADFDAAVLARLFAGRKTPLKGALLDQSLVAGLGNIYVCEALHRAGLSPRREARTLVGPGGAPTARAKRLVAAIRAVL
ncbi:MAG: DNA-formamidopyrimidine glycosylase family protein, partial [Roseiarcus sp.]